LKEIAKEVSKAIEETLRNKREIWYKCIFKAMMAM
jgi:hypothetical protein